jgi:hypothetical protein
LNRRTSILTALVFLVLGTGPTVGDVGACGKTATDLDEGAFRHGRKVVDCRRCNDCGLTAARCTRACDPNDPGDVAFPSTCRPLYHDGEVCLRALLAASCSDYAGYVDDGTPEVPSECAFCREAAP